MGEMIPTCGFPSRSAGTDVRLAYALAMTARVNGEVWSQGATGTMHWSFEDAIAKLSQDRSLVPGEIIGSGTVLNGCGFEIGKRLADGDVVELEIEGIGTLRNTVRFAAAWPASTFFAVQPTLSIGYGINLHQCNFGDFS
ncbi:fumarylacetoacetate hydrolase family protein [Sphingosinicella xenopeptidilytica]|uniref:Fumarylacetoacetate hydrolase family protein n=1 Tax=Sphingosinicella xenopeptidilytica TaxID=364098 RepID=A0ABW3BYG2_SPHXN